MSISSYVADLREKPEHIRRRAALGWSFGITAIIALFWIGSFSNIGIGAKDAAQHAVAATTDKIVTPGQSLIAGVGDVINDIYRAIVKPKQVEFSEVQILPGKH